MPRGRSHANTHLPGSAWELRRGPPPGGRPQGPGSGREPRRPAGPREPACVRAGRAPPAVTPPQGVAMETKGLVAGPDRRPGPRGQGRPQPLTATPEPRRASPPSPLVAHGARSRRRRRRPRAPRRRRAAPAAPAPLHPCPGGVGLWLREAGYLNPAAWRARCRAALRASARAPGSRPSCPTRPAPALGLFSTEHGASLLVLSLRPRYKAK